MSGKNPITELMQRFNNSVEPVRIEGIDYHAAAVINGKSIHSFIARNCIFKGRVHFEELDFGFGAKFINCQFLANVSFTRCKFLGYDQEFNVENYSILFEGCKFNLGLSFIQNQTERDLCIKNTTELKDLKIYQFESNSSGSIRINDSQLQGSVDFKDIDIKGEVLFSKSNIGEWVRFSNVRAGHYTFFHSQFNSNVLIWSGAAKGGIIFNYGEYRDDFSIEAVQCEGGITVAGDHFHKYLTINYFDSQGNTGGPSSFYLDGCMFDEGIYINGSQAPGNSFDIKRIDIPATNRLSGLIHFNGLTVLEIMRLSGLIQGAQILFENIRFQAIRIEYLSNFGSIQFVDVRSTRVGNTSFIITNSSLGKTSFLNTFLDSFDDTTILSSTVTDITSSYVRWFDSNRILSQSKEENDYSRNRDLFRQLKYAMLKQGDRVQALIFKRYEMMALRRELGFSNRRYGEKFMMWVNRSNDYGQDWIRPSLLGLLFTCILYIPFILSVAPELSFSMSIQKEDIQETLNILIKYVYIIFKLLNPAHNFEKLLPDIRENVLGQILDFLQRVVISYFIFQTVSAFRKYIKD